MVLPQPTIPALPAPKNRTIADITREQPGRAEEVRRGVRLLQAQLDATGWSIPADTDWSDELHDPLSEFLERHPERIGATFEAFDMIFGPERKDLGPPDTDSSSARTPPSDLAGQ